MSLIKKHFATTKLFQTILMCTRFRQHFLAQLTDYSSRHDSSECTASACLPQTLEASGRQHTLKWGCWGPGVSVEQIEIKKALLISVNTGVKYMFQKCIIRTWFLLPAALGAVQLSP